jgi:dsDNA-specific endonuclease/ATPase MutS2
MSSFDESPQPDSEAVYEVPIEDAFDLHPYRPADVLRMLDAYLDAALEKGFVEVRVIHGKGKGVQRSQVQSFLDRDPRVRRWQSAPVTRGGWGATLAWLQKPDSVGRP